MTDYVLNFAGYNKKHQVGGKAKNLFFLQKNGFPVPEFICINAHAFEDSIAPHIDQIESLLVECRFEDFKHLSYISSKIKKLIVSCELVSKLKDELEIKMKSLEEWTSFSVRSSANNEDSANNSFAGQLNTYLNVSKQDVEQRIKECWASAFEPGTLTYLKKLNCNPLDNKVSVIVQRMVFSYCSGVMFQADPRGGVHKEVIAAGFGLGEGIVSDKVESDLYIWNKLTKQWYLQVNEKKSRIEKNNHSGTRKTELPKSLSSKPVLSKEHRLALLEYSKQISCLYDHYQDIEWAIDEHNTLYILQSRPITALPRGKERVFDNSNIAESYPDVVLPITFSLLHRDYYYCVYHALKRFGVPSKVLKKRKRSLKRLVGYIDGRAYYNINNWYKVFLLSPFFKKRIIGYFEDMIGSEGSFTESVNEPALGLSEKLMLIMKFPIMFFVNLFSHEYLIKKYFERTNRLEQDFRSKNIAEFGSDELIVYLDDYTQEFMRLLSIPMLNDFFTMIFMSITREAFSVTRVDNTGVLLNTLLANQKIESSKPVESLQNLASTVREFRDLHDCLVMILRSAENHSIESISNILKNSGFFEFENVLGIHFKEYGHRSPKELIMEAQTYKENPMKFIKVILESSKVNAKKISNTENTAQEFEGVLGKSKWKRPLRWLLKRTRRAIAHREATRLNRGLHFSFFRSIMLSLGEQLASEGVFQKKSDIFFVSIEELTDFNSGCSANGDLMGLVNYRRQQAEIWREKKPEERLFTTGTVYANRIPSKFDTVETPTDQLGGLGCSEGIVQAEALVITDPGEASNVKGKILVSESTDPGWVFLMTMSSGLICERGSLLSHTAIIGRELGIPTIVGVKGATRLIRDGDLITMDGKTGQVHMTEVIKQAEC